MKLQQISEYVYMFICPGCEHRHVVHVNGKRNNNGASWTFNGDLNKPTFSPSINSAWGKLADPNWDDEGIEELSGRCHFYVKEGMIQFLPDCTHPLAGTTIELPNIKE